MRAGWFILGLGLAVAMTPPPSHAQPLAAAVGAAIEPGDPGHPGDARDRVAELAQRFGATAAAAGPASHDPAASPGDLAGVVVSPVEATPLGQIGSTGRRPPVSPDGAGVPGGAQATPEPASGSGGWVLSTLAALGVVIGLIYLFRFGYAKLSGAPRVLSTAAVEVLSRTSVAPRSHVLLLRVGGRILVVGESAGGLRTLSELEREDEVARLLQAVEVSRPQSIAGGFNHLLARFNRDFDPAADGLDPAAEGLDAGEHRVDRARDSVAGLAARLRLRSRKGDAA